MAFSCSIAQEGKLTCSPGRMYYKQQRRVFYRKDYGNRYNVLLAQCSHKTRL